MTFVLGCSFSFEWALREAGLRLRHIERGSTVPMYRTSIATAADRALPRADGGVDAALPPGRRHPRHPDHGALSRAFMARRCISACPRRSASAISHRPDFGDRVEIRGDEVPVFWACGVTPQAVIEEASPPFFISHFPGSMLITDLANAALAV